MGRVNRRNSEAARAKVLPETIPALRDSRQDEYEPLVDLLSWWEISFTCTLMPPAAVYSVQLFDFAHADISSRDASHSCDEAKAFADAEATAATAKL